MLKKMAALASISKRCLAFQNSSSRLTRSRRWRHAPDTGWCYYAIGRKNENEWMEYGLGPVRIKPRKIPWILSVSVSPERETDTEATITVCGSF